MFNYYIIEYSDSKGAQSHMTVKEESAIQFVAGILSAPESDSRVLNTILHVNSYSKKLQVLEPFINSRSKIALRVVSEGN